MNFGRFFLRSNDRVLFQILILLLIGSESFGARPAGSPRREPLSDDAAQVEATQIKNDAALARKLAIEEMEGFVAEKGHSYRAGKDQKLDDYRVAERFLKSFYAPRSKSKLSRQSKRKRNRGTSELIDSRVIAQNKVVAKNLAKASKSPRNKLIIEELVETLEKAGHFTPIRENACLAQVPSPRKPGFIQFTAKADISTKVGQRNLFKEGCKPSVSLSDHAPILDSAGELGTWNMGGWANKTWIPGGRDSKGKPLPPYLNHKFQHNVDGEPPTGKRKRPTRKGWV